MSSATDQDSPVLCTLEFHHTERNEKLFAEIHHPVSEIIYPKGAPGPVKDWGSRVKVVIGGVTHVKTSWSVSWLSSFWLALDYVRMFIPPEEERQWVDADGVEVWCLLPRKVPFSWGYELYEKISRFSDDAERELVSRIERRRLEYERRRDESSA